MFGMYMWLQNAAERNHINFKLSMSMNCRVNCSANVGVCKRCRLVNYDIVVVVFWKISLFCEVLKSWWKIAESALKRFDQHASNENFLSLPCRFSPLLIRLSPLTEDINISPFQRLYETRSVKYYCVLKASMFVLTIVLLGAKFTS